jgi:uncharacterized linocin/CFP29 family protein
MNHLLRSLAPISDAGWQLLDEEARQRLAPALGARKLVDFDGPHGWTHSATNLGRTTALEAAPVDGVAARQRRVLPLVELRAQFALSRDELRDADRGADDTDLSPLDEAALRMARAENLAVLQGAAGLAGIGESTPYERRALGDDPAAYPAELAGAVEQLLLGGIGGPYGLALGDKPYRGVLGGSEHGYPVVDHLRKVIEGPVVWTPGLEGGVLVSLRGGDFVFDCGQDLSIGYDSHDRDVVHLYLEESFSFHVATPEAAVVLGPPDRSGP